MTDPGDRPWRRSGAFVELRIRLTPKGGRDAVEGLTASPDGPALKARVRAAPEDGAANAALIELVSDWLDLPKRDLTLASGHKSRTKLLTISGDAAAVEQHLKAKSTSFGDPPTNKTAKRMEKRR